MGSQIPTLPDVEWWQNYGPLGVVSLIVAAIVVTYFWWLHFPYARSRQEQELTYRAKKQALETLREEKLNLFIDKLSETHGEEVEFKRQIALAVTDIAKTQRSHSEGCARTELKLDELVERMAGPLQLTHGKQ